jgi:hypothetical protein
MKFGYFSKDVGYGKKQIALYLSNEEEEHGLASCPAGDFYFKLDEMQLKILKENLGKEKITIKDIPKESKKNFKELSDLLEKEETILPGRIVENFLNSALEN